MDNDTATHVLRHCDRTRSSEARHVLQSELWTPLISHGIHLTSSCILAPANDVLLLQELSKTHLHSQLWQCSLCSKLFRSEHFLDRHLSRRHPDLRPQSASVCLADLCSSIVPCLPTTTSPQGPVSTALLSTTESYTKAKSPEHQHLHPICHDLAARRRLERACDHVINDCLHSAIHSETPASLQKHFVRLSERLCQRVVDVECTSHSDASNLVSSRIAPLHNSIFPFILAFLTVVAAVAFTFVCLTILHDRLHPTSIKIIRRRLSPKLNCATRSKKTRTRLK